MYRLHDAAQRHVDASSKEGRGEEEGLRLHNINSKRPIGSLSMGNDATDIASDFDWIRGLALEARSRWSRIGNR